MSEHEEKTRTAIGAALIRSGIYDNDKIDLLQWHPCPGCPRAQDGVCSCSGVPYISDEVWRELRPVIDHIRRGLL